MSMTLEAMRWWKKDNNTASSVTGVVTIMAQNSLNRIRDYRIGAVLYGATDLWGPYSLATAVSTPLPAADTGRLRINVTQSCTDTLASKIGKNRPSVMYVTRGGDYSKQREGEKLTALMDGIFIENDAYSMGQRAFVDACVMGDGFVQVSMRAGRVHYERVPAWELFIDDTACVSSPPRQMHRVRMVERDILMKRYPDKAEQVAGVPPGQVVFPLTSATNLTDLVEFRESWHLPSADGADDGRYVASVSDLLLADEPYKRHRFPFARFRWCPRTGGYWSQGLAEQLRPIQIDINREAALLQKAHYRQVTFDWWVPTSANVATDKISNDVGALVKFSGPQPPFSSAPPPAAPERYRWLQWLVEKAYEISGVSQMASSSVIPAGMESGKAIRALSDVGTDRFRSAGQEQERFFVELADITIDTLSDYTKSGATYPVKAPSWSRFSDIDFKKIRLDREEYVLSAFPTSSLPNEPAGRIQEIEDMERRGVISSVTAQRLYNFPDVQAQTNLITAAENYAARLFEKMLDGEYIAPEPYDDVKQLRISALQHYNLWRQQDVGEKPLEMLRLFLTQLSDIEVKATPPAPIMPPTGPSLAGPPMPGAGPSLVPPPVGAPMVGAPPMPVTA